MEQVILISSMGVAAPLHTKGVEVSDMDILLSTYYSMLNNTYENRICLISTAKDETSHKGISRGNIEKQIPIF